LKEKNTEKDRRQGGERKKKRRTESRGPRQGENKDHGEVSVKKNFSKPGKELISKRGRIGRKKDKENELKNNNEGGEKKEKKRKDNNERTKQSGTKQNDNTGEVYVCSLFEDKHSKKDKRGRRTEPNGSGKAGPGGDGVKKEERCRRLLAKASFYGLEKGELKGRGGGKSRKEGQAVEISIRKKRGESKVLIGEG